MSRTSRPGIPDWRDYPAAELERQYTAIVPADFNSRVVPGWEARSARFRTRARGALDLAYGPGPRERLDVFHARPRERSPAVIFFHGGYWQRFDKSVFSFVAEGLVREGVSVVAPSYALCPSVHLSQIVGQARRAVAWAWFAAPELNLDRDRFFVIGHSAGGHLAARLMATPWRQVADALPADLLKGAAPISGLFELEPLRRTSINEALRMDEAEAARESPVSEAPVTDAPQLVTCGEFEPDEFHRQSDLYAGRIGKPGRSVRRCTIPGRDHMDELDDLADARSGFFAEVMSLVGPE